jgi:uncharacterized membrane protein
MLKSNVLKGDTYTANFDSFKLGVTDFISEKHGAVYYEALLAIYNKETGETLSRALAVNHPQRINGWKIFLIGYDETEPDYVSISMIFKYDPGKYITLVGIWLIITGVIVMCFFKPRKKADKFDKTDKIERIFPYFIILPGIVMISSFFIDPAAIWNLVPALQSIWFIPHILAYVISYSLCAVAAVLSIIWFFNKTRRDKLETGIYNLIRISFPFMTIGILFGAMWANEVWGEFWSWDVKENWALITWMCYAIYLHCRLHKPSKKVMHVLIILGFAALLMTLLGVSFFGSGSPHSYI